MPQSTCSVLFDYTSTEMLIKLQLVIIYAPDANDGNCINSNKWKLRSSLNSIIYTRFWVNLQPAFPSQADVILNNIKVCLLEAESSQRQWEAKGDKSIHASVPTKWWGCATVSFVSGNLKQLLTPVDTNHCNSFTAVPRLIIRFANQLWMSHNARFQIFISFVRTLICYPILRLNFIETF